VEKKKKFSGKVNVLKLKKVPASLEHKKEEKKALPESHQE